MSRGIQVALKMKDWLSDAGFVDVVEKQVLVPWLLHHYQHQKSCLGGRGHTVQLFHLRCDVIVATVGPRTLNISRWAYTPRIMFWTA
jgi:hypothetical protein